MTVAMLSPEARATVGLSVPHEDRSGWVLARARTMSAGLRLVLHEIDEIGISLKNGWVTPEQAAADLAALEQLPVHVASVFHQCEAGG